MSSFRLPKIICGSWLVNWIDFGTMCLSQSPKPGSLKTDEWSRNQSSQPQLGETNELEYLTVPYGQLTFDAEGNDDPETPWFSRKPHVPTDNSGVTIGRGYDMGEKDAAKIKKDLISAGITELAESFSKVAKKKGNNAKEAIKNEKLSDKVITRRQQWELFLISYTEIETDVKRICDKEDVIQKYGKADWGKLNPKIKDMLVDLRFRGDYTGASRSYIQKHVVNNNLTELKAVICNKEIWPLVPADRFNRRCNYLK